MPIPVKRTLHFIYPLPPKRGPLGAWINLGGLNSRQEQLSRYRWPFPNHAPFSISFQVAKALGAQYRVKLYDYNENRSFSASPDDIILSHPKVDLSSLDPMTGMCSAVDRDSVAWRGLADNPKARRVLFLPYVPRYDDQWLSSLVPDLACEMVAICGSIWMPPNFRSAITDRLDRFTRLDMGIAPTEYPYIKSQFSSPGKRRFLYVGHTGHYKNTAMLEQLANRIDGFQGGHIGHGSIRGWVRLAQEMRFTEETVRRLAKVYDIFIAASTGDAQATTVLEFSCFGFPVVCTPETGYSHAPLISISCSNVEENLEVIQRIQEMPNELLLQHSKQGRKWACEGYSWSTFTSRLLAFLEQAG